MQAIVAPVFTFEIVVVVGLVKLMDAWRGFRGLPDPQPARKPTATSRLDARTFTLRDHLRFVGQVRTALHWAGPASLRPSRRSTDHLAGEIFNAAIVARR